MGAEVSLSVVDNKRLAVSGFLMFNYRVWRCEDWTAEMWTTSHGRCQVSLQTQCVL